MTEAIYGADLIVNNEKVDYVPNSLTITLGKGERNLMPLVNGTAGVTVVYSEDISTKKSKVMFDLPTTADNLELVTGWLNNRNANVVSVVNGEEVSLAFLQATVINDPEFATGNEPTVSIEMEALPASIG